MGPLTDDQKNAASRPFRNLLLRNRGGGYTDDQKDAAARPFRILSSRSGSDSDISQEEEEEDYGLPARYDDDELPHYDPPPYDPQSDIKCGVIYLFGQGLEYCYPRVNPISSGRFVGKQLRNCH